MALVKVVKNKAYFKRFQVKMRRRREGKTNYKTRKTLISQEKNKYNTKKYRFVVRITSSKVICQVIYATLNGDYVIAAADSSELVGYGVPVGLTNYAACYATGLLLARRLLKSLNMDKEFMGVEKATGEEYHAEEVAEDRRPFKCLLDVGIIRTTKGNRVFGAMKGACDGGLHIPHSNKKFFGASGDSYDAEAHRERIFGVHVSNYMKLLQDEDPDKYQQQFALYIKNNIDADSIEDMYASCHQKIKDDPKHNKIDKPKFPIVKEGNVIKTSKGSYVKFKKLNSEQKKARVAQKMKILQEQLEVNSSAE